MIRFQVRWKASTRMIKSSLQLTPEGQNSLILYRQGQNSKIIPSAKHEGPSA